MQARAGRSGRHQGPVQRPAQRPAMPLGRLYPRRRRPAFECHGTRSFMQAHACKHVPQAPISGLQCFSGRPAGHYGPVVSAATDAKPVPTYTRRTRGPAGSRQAPQAPADNAAAAAQQAPPPPHPPHLVKEVSAVRSVATDRPSFWKLLRGSTSAIAWTGGAGGRVAGAEPTSCVCRLYRYLCMARAPALPVACCL